MSQKIRLRLTDRRRPVFISGLYTCAHMRSCVCVNLHLLTCSDICTYIHFYFLICAENWSQLCQFPSICISKKKSDGDADDILGVVIRNTEVIWETRHDVVAYLTAVPQVMK